MTFSLVRLLSLVGLAAAAGLTLAATPAAAQNPMSFQYGNYCGPGVPNQTAAAGMSAERLAVLDGWWAPADDLDALCFAHDYCFEMIGMDSIICDNAMQAALATFSQSAGPSCAALASNMATAFEYKPWSRGALGRASGILQAIGNAEDVGGNDLRDVGINQVIANLGASQAAGSCNAAGAASANPHSALAQFASHVQYTGGVSGFRICAPDQAANGYCTHTAPASIPNTAAGVAPGATQVEEVGQAVDAIRGLFGRN